jgi:hypothetical protein
MTIDIESMRAKIVAFWLSVTPAKLNSKAADLVCERRQYCKGYSGCADLAHAGYAHLGLSGEHVNRAPTWRIGKNVSLLSHWVGVTLPPPENLMSVLPGDILIRWSRSDTTDAHVVCVCSPPSAGVIETCEWGQTAPEIGRRFQRLVQPLRSQRPWKAWLPLPLVIAACSEGGSNV